MRRSYFVFALLAAVLALSLSSVRAVENRTGRLSTLQQNMYTSAVELFRQQRYSAAYGRFVRLADDGHIPSAQLALVMYHNGPTLFGSSWDATPEQLEHWRELVIKDERRL